MMSNCCLPPQRLQRVELVEQPLPAGGDDVLARIARPVPVCADELVHDRASLAALAHRYDAVNIKLDKTGGLTEALLLAEEARRRLKIMVGSMVATSLAMAPPCSLRETPTGRISTVRFRSSATACRGSAMRPAWVSPRRCPRCGSS